LLGLELCQVGALDQAATGLEGKYLPSGCEEHLLHVFCAHAEAATSDAGDDLVFLLAGFPLSSETEERGMKYGGGQPGVALADSLTPGYFLTPLRGF
jgi:hypothetical protein